MENFFQSVYQAILRLIPFQTLKAIVIASPGFTKESVSPLLYLPHLMRADDSYTITYSTKQL
jgi:stalled ribosome rescue protein Dom34